jgi:hypothetical protein
MKFTTKTYLFFTFLLTVTVGSAQVGVGIEAPEGMLDLQNNNSHGFVFPKAALTATNVEAPVTNPNPDPMDPGLEEGTIIFNTNTTSTGSNDVYPGIYAWDGNQWIPQYLREDSGLFKQSPKDYRTVTGNTSFPGPSTDWADVPNLGAGSTFTPKYTGTYRVKCNFNFGAGKIVLPTVGDISMSTQEGMFKFTFDGTEHDIYTHAYSLYNAGIAGGTYYDNFKHDSSLVLYETLTAGVTYNFRLEIDIYLSYDYENGGDSGDGRGHVGTDTPCTVEFTYLEE